MIEVINFQEDIYPKFQSEGNASQFCIPFAKHFCSGDGLDIGCMKKEWSFPGSVAIDLNFEDPWDAYNLPNKKYDYIFSSHCLEHLNDWVKALDYWGDHLKNNGVLFLYLPHYNQKYWRPWNNRKHINCFTPEIIVDYMKDRKYINILNSQMDLNHSFIVVGQKRDE